MFSKGYFKLTHNILDGLFANKENTTVAESWFICLFLQQKKHIKNYT